MKRFVAAPLVVVAFVVVAVELAAAITAQSQASSAPLPNLTGIWKRRGPIEGRSGNTSPVPLARARAIGFSRAFDEGCCPGTTAARSPSPSC